MDKEKLRERFRKEWEKHYKIDALLNRGYERYQCKKCGKFFWAKIERDVCPDPQCIGYEFIGNAPSNLKLGYVETWEKIKEYFVSHGHTYVEPYPTVARWRDDLYFTIASISDFQPYVVNGELEPPGNPLIVPQPCIRFGDIANVGTTGRHYTNFVMIGQHAFNTEKTGLFYWKNEAIEHDIEYVKSLGIPEEEIIFIEDVWAGGGNFGPCLEYFSRGLELGNCVFMQYEIKNGVERELKTKVIDMGAGLSRLCWITHGCPTSYEVVFGNVVERMKRKNGISVDEQLMFRYGKMAGGLTVDEVENLEEERKKISNALGVDVDYLAEVFEPLHAIYATADHTLTLLFTTLDGMLPSNSGGGYNLRIIARRMFSFEERYGLEFDYAEILEGHAEHLKGLFPRLKGGIESTNEVIKEEKRKYEESKGKARAKLRVVIKKAKEEGRAIKEEEVLLLYQSHGVDPLIVKRECEKEGVDVDIPGDFYEKVRTADEVDRVRAGKGLATEEIDVSKYKKTEALYYTTIGTFEAEVLGVEGKYIILDRTAFYPEGGGQVGDTGFLNGKKVLNTIKKGNVVLHEVDEPEKFKPGEVVKGEVDLERRKQITRHHTAAHLLVAAARKVLGPHVWQAGSYKDEEKAHFDITHFRRITQEELDEIEKEVNKYIMQNVPIHIEVLPRTQAEQKYGFSLYQGGAIPSKDLRVVHIEGIDAEACGGTHHMLERTGEIGVFKIVKRESVQDGIERITFKAGIVAVAFIQEKENLLKKASSMLSVSDAELPNAVARFFKEWKERGKRIEKMEEEMAKMITEKIKKEGKEKDVVEVEIPCDVGLMQKIADMIKDEGINCIMINNEGRFVLVGKNDAMADELLMKMKEKGGRGGGKGKIRFGKI